MAVMREIGPTFRQIRHHYKKTLKTVSEGTGLSISFLSDMERGRTNPSLKTIITLAGYYDLEVMIGLVPTTGSDRGETHELTIQQRL